MGPQGILDKGIPEEHNVAIRGKWIANQKFFSCRGPSNIMSNNV